MIFAGCKRNDAELLCSQVRASEDGAVHGVQLENPEIRPNQVPRRLFDLQVRTPTTQARAHADFMVDFER